MDRKVYHLEEHKELHKRIMDCGCTPYIHGRPYCLECHFALLGFADKFGIGTLTRDIQLQDLQTEIKKLEETNINLSNKLESKIKRVEELKASHIVNNVKEKGK